MTDSPLSAETSAWFAYKAVARKQNREVDERTFRDAWRSGARFTFTATSKLSPTLDAFVRWVEYVTDWAPDQSVVGVSDAPGNDPGGAA